MRRRILLAASAAAALGGLSSAGVREFPVPGLEQRFSAARGRVVDFWTAVPAGHGDGRGLPVCLVLHGGSKRPADFTALGLHRFLNDAVRRGTPPFVLAGATGDRLGWKPSGRDDPQRMVHEEVPAWCAERGFDTSRLAAWGWSMGGSGALLLAATFPGFLRAVAAFSPAVGSAFPPAAHLTGLQIGLWCGRGDPLYPNVRKLHTSLATPPSVYEYGAGRHNFDYWRTLIPTAFLFVGGILAAGGLTGSTD